MENALLNFFETVNHRRVVTSPKGISTLDALGGKKLPRQVHGYLPWCGKCFRSRFRAKSVYGDSPFLGDSLLNCEDSEGGISFLLEPFDRAKLVSESFSCDVNRNVLVLEGSVSEKLDNGSFELSHVRSNVLRNEVNNIV